MKILCITDKGAREEETALKGIFEHYLLQYCSCDMVYFIKDKVELHRSPNGFMEPSKLYPNQQKIFYLPYSCKHRHFALFFNRLALQSHLEDYDIILVRNFYPILKQILKHKANHQKVAFWETFPHDYRRLYEAQTSPKKSKLRILRMWIEYKIKLKNRLYLLKNCQMYFGSTLSFKDFYPNLKIPFSSIANGIDFSKCDIEAINNNIQSLNNPLKFIYIGAIDKNRQIDRVISAFTQIESDFILDIFSSSHNETTISLKNSIANDSRINFYPAVSFSEILQKLPHYDVGLAIIPNTPLYQVSSPIKAMEYVANGVIPFINDLPEYKRLFSTECAIITPSFEAILETLRSIFKLPQEDLIHKKNTAYKIAKEKIDYKIITSNLYKEFLLLTQKS